MKNVIGELVKERKGWHTSPRVRRVCSARIDQRTKDSSYDLCIMGVEPGSWASLPPNAERIIDTVFKHFEDNTSWEDHVVWVKPEFAGVCIDQIKYLKKNQIKFVKLLLQDNTEVWMHINDVEIV